MNWIWIVLLTLTGLGFVAINMLQRRQNRDIEAAENKAEQDLNAEQQQLDEITSDGTMSLQEMTLTIWTWSAVSNKLTLYTRGVFQQGLQYASAKGSELPMMSYEDYVNHLVHPDDRKRMLQAFNDLIAGKDWKMSVKYRARLLRDKEQMEWVDAFALATEHDAEGKAIAMLGSVEVVGEQHHLADKLTEIKQHQASAKKRYQQATESIIREQAAPIHHILDIARKYVMTQDADERASLANEMNEAQKRCQQTHEDVRHLVELENGLWTYIQMECCLDDVMQASVMMLQESMPMNKPAIKIATSCPQPPLKASIDMNALLVVLYHLLRNAYKFSDSGTITIGYEQPQDGSVRFFVSDEGCGIPDDQKPLVFDLFYKGNPQQPGLGIGLRLASRLVQSLNGELGLESTEGKGSTFWFHVPFMS